MDKNVLLQVELNLSGLDSWQRRPATATVLCAMQLLLFVMRLTMIVWMTLLFYVQSLQPAAIHFLPSGSVSVGDMWVSSHV